MLFYFSGVIVDQYRSHKNFFFFLQENDYFVKLLSNGNELKFKGYADLIPLQKYDLSLYILITKPCAKRKIVILLYSVLIFRFLEMMQIYRAKTMNEE